MKTSLICAVLLLLASFWPGRAGRASAAAAADYPFEIPFELGTAEFSPGDQITIQKLRGTGGTIKAGESFCVEGSYTLASLPEAELAFLASVQSTNSTPMDRKQLAVVKRGSGTFRLEKTMTEDGYLHVSFYPVPGGDCFGGIYFGQGQWVMKQKGFSRPVAAPSATARPAPGPGAGNGEVSLAPANRRILEFLGEPVAAPANVDSRYTQTGLTEAVKTAAHKCGVTLKQVTIEDSEYPFLVGINCVDGEFPKLEEQLKKMSGYEYQGSVGWSTCYAINIVPWSTSPPGAGQRVSRRSTLRQAMLYERILGVR